MQEPKKEITSRKIVLFGELVLAMLWFNFIIGVFLLIMHDREYKTMKNKKVETEPRLILYHNHVPQGITREYCVICFAKLNSCPLI